MSHFLPGDINKDTLLPEQFDSRCPKTDIGAPLKQGILGKARYVKFLEMPNCKPLYFARDIHEQIFYSLFISDHIFSVFVQLGKQSVKWAWRDTILQVGEK